MEHLCDDIPYKAWGILFFNPHAFFYINSHYASGGQTILNSLQQWGYHSFICKRFLKNRLQCHEEQKKIRKALYIKGISDKNILNKKNNSLHYRLQRKEKAYIVMYIL